MKFGFASVEHFAASAFSDLHKALQFVEKEVPVVAKAEPLVEGITAVVLGPQAAAPAMTIERAAFAALGTVAAAALAADEAAAAKGINISLDAEAVAAYKNLVATFKGDLKQLGYSF